MVTNLEQLLRVMLLYLLITWSYKIALKISTTTVSLSTKLGRMVTNLEQLLPMLLYSLVAFSSEMT